MGFVMQRPNTRSAEEQVLNLIEEAAAVDEDFACLLWEAWEERLSIITADGISLEIAERTALRQLHAMLARHAR